MSLFDKFTLSLDGRPRIFLKGVAAQSALPPYILFKKSVFLGKKKCLEKCLVSHKGVKKSVDKNYQLIICRLLEKFIKKEVSMYRLIMVY